MSIHESGEDYLETILLFKKEGKEQVKSIEIAHRLNYARASVSKAMKKLQNDGYIIFNENESISLTQAGLNKAEMILNRHEKLTDFFVSLGVDKKIAEQDACKIEHDISEETFNALMSIKK